MMVTQLDIPFEEVGCRKKKMHICVDVYYTEDYAITSGAIFQHWKDSEPVGEKIAVSSDVQPYVPGQFYKRELAPVLQLLELVSDELETVIIDGFVWLDDVETPGLGAHVFDALKGQVPVVGVAKNRFRDSTASVEVVRGGSARPLFVTAVGMELQKAAESVRDMHGPYRIPTILKHADRLGRDEATRRMANG